MLSSIPVPQIPLSETALYQMCADLSDLLCAGWKMEIVPTPDNPLTAFVAFAQMPGATVTIAPTSPLTGRHGSSVVRFALASDLPAIVHNMHRRVFPPSSSQPDDDNLLA